MARNCQLPLQITHDAIAQRAYDLWVERGRPEGGDGREDWDAAVAQLTAEAIEPQDEPATAPPLLRLWRKIRNRAALA